MDLRGKRIEEGYTNLVTVEGDSVASSGKLQNGQGTDLGNVAVGGLSFNSGDSELQLPAGTTAERPASPSAGYARFNTDKDKVEIFTGASWLSIALEGAVQLEAATATVTGQDAVAELGGFISQFGTPASAFSVRQLGDTDVAMRVRRSSDNVEQNIGFTSDGDLDETALTTFVGANDGFVTAWYDQSVDNSTLPAEHGSGATASYSLRLVDSTYTGDAIRVRRSSDNTEQDIGFVDGELDTSTLETFCSGTNGFVTTWYDQSGSNNATQATAGSQPQIVSSGTTIKENGKPALSVTEGDSMNISSLTLENNASIFAVIKNADQTGGGSIHRPLLAGGDSDPYGPDSTAYNLGLSRDGSDGVRFTNPSTSGSEETLVISLTTDNTMILVTGIGASGTANLYVDGGSNVNSSFTERTTGFQSSYILFADPTGRVHQGGASEFIIYNSDQSSNRESIELNQASYYDIGVSIGATQSTAGSQPKIVSSGTVIKENSVPALDFDGTADTLDIAPSIPLTTDNSLFFVTTSPSNSQSYMLANAGGSGGSPAIIANYVGTSIELYNNISGQEDRYDFISSITNGTQVLLSYIIDNQTTGTTYADGTQGETFTPVANMNGTEYDTIGQTSQDSGYSDIKVQELVVYNSDKSADRTSIESDIATYFNITI